MARAFVVPEPGWAARQMLATTLERLGYEVDIFGRGDDWLLLLR